MVYRQSIQSLIEKNVEFIPLLPECDRVLLDLAKKYKQKEVALFYGMTQGAVSSKLKKIKRRLEFLEVVQKFDIRNLEKDLIQIDDSITEFEVSLVHWFIKTTSQSATAGILNGLFSLKGLAKMNQIKVRHRYHKILSKLRKKEDSEIARRYFDFLSYVNNNVYMMYDLKLPQFDRA